MNKAQDRKKSDFKQGKVFGVGNSCKTFQNGHSKSSTCCLIISICEFITGWFQELIRTINIK